MMQPITITSEKYGDFQLQELEEENTYILIFAVDGRQFKAKKQMHTPNQDWALTGPDGGTRYDAMKMQNHIGKLIDQALKNLKE